MNRNACTSCHRSALLCYRPYPFVPMPFCHPFLQTYPTRSLSPPPSVLKDCRLTSFATTGRHPGTEPDGLSIQQHLYFMRLRCKRLFAKLTRASSLGTPHCIRFGCSRVILETFHNSKCQEESRTKASLLSGSDLRGYRKGGWSSVIFSRLW